VLFLALVVNQRPGLSPGQLCPHREKIPKTSQVAKAAWLVFLKVIHILYIEMFMQKQVSGNNAQTLLFSVVFFLFLQLISFSLLAAPGDVLFNDDFERITLGADWTIDNSGGGDAGIDTYTANSGSRSLYTRWNATAVTSRSFDLSAVSGAELTIWVRRGSDAFSEDPEVAGPEDLVIEYRDDVGNWQLLTRYVAGDTPGQIFTPTFYLSANALHTNFQVRFRQIGGDGVDWDYWHIDDVVLTETAGLPTLSFPFCDDFESGLNNWQVSFGGGDAGTGNQTSNSASNSLYLRWGDVSVVSNNIDLSAIGIANLGFWLRRGSDSFSEDPDNGEDFSVEYFNNSGAWINLETFPGNGTPGEIFNRRYMLPADALHNQFKIRFTMMGNDGSDWDYWHVDDICVEPPPAPVAIYLLDETSWGTVIDSSGNGNNGLVTGGVLPENITPAASGNPGTCGYAEIPFNNSNNVYDAIDTGIDVDGDIGNVGSINFWYKSNERWNENRGDRQLLDASTTNFGQKYFFLTLQNNSRLRFGLEDSIDGDYSFEGGNNSFNTDVWVHITITWDLPNDVLQIYINGNLDAQQVFSTNGILGNMDTLYLGDNRSTYQISGMTGNSANGSIDETRIYNFVLSQTEIQADMNATHPCGSVLDHFVISHNNVGINCLAEPITVTAKLSGGATYTGYTGSIVLDTQSAAGTWTLNTGTTLNFSDATANDGLATYIFDVADNGVAIFDLDYQNGVASVDIDAYEGIVRDDDTEGNLVFSPNGFTVTASPLAVPFLGVIDTTIPVQTAAIDFPLYLAAYGVTPTDPVCGIIEAYTGAKNLKFWSTYNNPGTGTLPVTINTINAFTDELTANAGSTQPVTFTNGQAAITVNYADVGQITLTMKDDSVTADLPTGIRGTSDSFVVKPADFILSAIERSSDSFMNPGTATDENSTLFIAAGNNFSVTVTAVNALGNATPNYGQESIAESVVLTPVLVAAGAANNPPIAFTTGFDGFIAGIDTGTDFHWDEVGIITLTPNVADGDYLGGGDVMGTTSANIGRFYPNHFVTNIDSNGSLANTCTTGTAFTYLGENFAYLGNPLFTTGNPVVTISAMSAHAHLPNLPLANYTGVWAKLGTGGVSLAYPVADNTQLDESGATLIAAISTPGTLSRVDNADGTLTFTLGGASADNFAYERSAGQVTPFTSNLTISLTAVSDGEASANDTPRNINPIGNLQRFGRAHALDAYGTMSQVGDSLLMPVSSWFFNTSSRWALNTDDSCSSYSYTKADTSITATTAPVSPVTLASGAGNLTLTLTGAGNPGGSSVINTVWPSWLQYDYDAVDQLLDGNLYDDNPSATATFGIFRGDDRYLYWREGP